MRWVWFTKEEQLGKGEGANIVKTYEYDAYGRQTAIKAGAGSVSTRMQYEYDQFDRLTKHIKGSDKTTYTYDYFGRRASMEDRQGDLTILTTWKYDKSNQLYSLYRMERLLITDTTVPVKWLQCNTVRKEMCAP